MHEHARESHRDKNHSDINHSDKKHSDQGETDELQDNLEELLSLSEEIISLRKEPPSLGSATNAEPKETTEQTADKTADKIAEVDKNRDKSLVIALEKNAVTHLNPKEKEHVVFTEQLNSLLKKRNKLVIDKEQNSTNLFPGEENTKNDSLIEKVNSEITAHIKGNYPTFSELKSKEITAVVINILSNSTLLCTEKAHRLAEHSNRRLQKSSVSTSDGTFYHNTAVHMLSGGFIGSIGGGLMTSAYAVISRAAGYTPSGSIAIALTAATAITASLIFNKFHFSKSTREYNSPKIQDAIKLKSLVKEMQNKYREPHTP